MDIKYIKSAIKLLNRVLVNKRGLDLSKEVLWVSVGQRVAVLQALKVDQPCAGNPGSNQATRQNFFFTTNFDG